MKYKIFSLIMIVMSCVLFVINCSSSKHSLIVNDKSLITINGKKITTNDVKDLQNAFSKLKSTRHKFNTKPDLTIIIKKTEEIIYSIYLEEQLIFPDYYHQAWADRMDGKSSQCYKFNDKSQEILTKLFQKYK